MGPGTGQADEKVVAALFGGELGSGFARDSIAKGGLEGLRRGQNGCCRFRGSLLEGEVSSYIFADKLARLLVCPRRDAGFLFSLPPASVKEAQ